MFFRCADPRLVDPDPALALTIDLLKVCVSDRDLDFMFAELSHISEVTWRVPVDSNRALRFEWVTDFGAINIRIE